MKIAVIIPVYNEANVIYDHFNKINDILKCHSIDAHYLLIDDGSKDETILMLKKITTDFENVEYISFARNFGKEMALCAGIDYIKADRYVIMDSDLQHPPSHIPHMLKQMDETGVNIIDGIKSSRGKENGRYKFIANSFYKSLKLLTNLDMNNSSDFKIIDDYVAESIREFSERNLFFRGIIDWVGFSRSIYYFDVEEREKGQSSFSVKSLSKLALTAVFSYTSKPLFIPMIMSLVFLLAALILGIQTLYNYFAGIAVSGFSTVILLLLIIGSILTFSLGIIGIYIARIYDEVKKRPRYILKDKEIKKTNEKIN